MMHRLLPLFLTAGLLVAFRVVGSMFPETLPNFQPLTALFFCGALLAGGWRGLALPFVVWAITFPLGVGHTANPLDFVTTLGSLLCVFVLGKSFVGRPSGVKLGGSVAAAVVFHTVTCTAAWLTDPMYAKTLTGLWQSLWAGAPGSPLPSWVFLRNMAGANLLFTAIILASQAHLPSLAARTPPVRATS